MSVFWSSPGGGTRPDAEPSSASHSRDISGESPLLSAADITKAFSVRGRSFSRNAGYLRAVDGVALKLWAGRTLGLVGESGSGKTTLGRLLVRLMDVSSGTIEFQGRDITNLRGGELRTAREALQMVFQDPFASFDPSARVRNSVAEPLTVNSEVSRRERRRQVEDLFERVGLSDKYLDSYPAELSGGQLQRAAIARALSSEPRLVVLDEPVSALDVSTQAQIINLLRALQDESRVGFLFVSHDLAVVRHVSSHIAVMYLGRIVEEGPTEEVYTRPKHPYTAALLSAVPIPDPVAQRRRSKIVLKGELPSPIKPPSGCRFRTRCPHAGDICASTEPPPYRTDDGSTVFCHLHTAGPHLAGSSTNEIDPNLSIDEVGW